MMLKDEPMVRAQMQRVFDRVVLHLLQQNRASIAVITDKYLGPKATCAYRGRRAAKCAVGFLIDDACYSRALEGKRAYDEDVLAALQMSGIPISQPLINLLMALQEVHDMSAPSRWRERLERVAQSFKLRMPALLSEVVARPAGGEIADMYEGLELLPYIKCNHPMWEYA